MISLSATCYGRPSGLPVGGEVAQPAPISAGEKITL